jgi:integrase/recombinase XerD
MRRDPATDAATFFAAPGTTCTVYMPRFAAMSPKTIEAYRISLECFLGYLAD